MKRRRGIINPDGTTTAAFQSTSSFTTGSAAPTVSAAKSAGIYQLPRTRRAARRISRTCRSTQTCIRCYASASSGAEAAVAGSCRRSKTKTIRAACTSCADTAIQGHAGTLRARQSANRAGSGSPRYSKNTDPSACHDARTGLCTCTCTCADAGFHARTYEAADDDGYASHVVSAGAATHGPAPIYRL